MLYHMRMDVLIPQGQDEAEINRLKLAEKARSAALQRSGEWVHLRRIAGEYVNISIFDVPDHDTLHAILSTLPLFPFMRVVVMPLARHPSAIR